MFEFFTIAISCVVVSGLLWGAYAQNDTFHPLVYLMPMVGYFYVIMPYRVWNSGALLEHFSTSEAVMVQGLNLAGVIALVLGCLVGSRLLKRDPQRMSRHALLAPESWTRYALYGSMILGGVGVLLYAYNLGNVGGLVRAYDSPKGGGTAASGYLRDFVLLVIPAIALLFLSHQRRPWTLKSRLLLAAYLFPLAIHGLLGARRGFTFMAIACVAASWYLTKNRRPGLSKVLTGGATVGLLLMMLVTFRSEIYIGSSFFSGDRPSAREMVEQTLEKEEEADLGNEFMYGTYVVVSAQEQNDFYWGARYLAHTFVRPIPSSIWPNKYRDIGLEGLLVNAGTLGEEGIELVGQHKLPPGAAPGFISDLFVEFSWGAIPATFLIGLFYGWLWRRSLTMGGLWTVLYICAVTFSLFVISQTLIAAFVRFLVVCIPTIVLWNALEKRVQNRVRPSSLARQRVPQLNR